MDKVLFVSLAFGGFQKYIPTIITALNLNTRKANFGMLFVVPNDGLTKSVIRWINRNFGALDNVYFQYLRH